MSIGSKHLLAWVINCRCRYTSNWASVGVLSIDIMIKACVHSSNLTRYIPHIHITMTRARHSWPIPALERIRPEGGMLPRISGPHLSPFSLQPGTSTCWATFPAQPLTWKPTQQAPWSNCYRSSVPGELKAVLSLKFIFYLFIISALKRHTAVPIL